MEKVMSNSETYLWDINLRLQIKSKDTGVRLIKKVIEFLHIASDYKITRFRQEKFETFLRLYIFNIGNKSHFIGVFFHI